MTAVRNAANCAGSVDLAKTSSTLMLPRHVDDAWPADGHAACFAEETGWRLALQRSKSPLQPKRRQTSRSCFLRYARVGRNKLAFALGLTRPESYNGFPLMDIIVKDNQTVPTLVTRHRRWQQPVGRGLVAGTDDLPAQPQWKHDAVPLGAGIANNPESFLVKASARSACAAS